MGLRSIFICSVGQTGFDFLLWRIWLFFWDLTMGFCWWPALHNGVHVLALSLWLGKGFLTTSPRLCSGTRHGEALWNHHCLLHQSQLPLLWCLQAVEGISPHWQHLLLERILKSHLLHGDPQSSFCYFIHDDSNAGLCFICIYLVSEVPFVLSVFP